MDQACRFLLQLSLIVVTAETIRIATFNCEFLNSKRIHIKFGESFNLSATDAATWTPAFREQKLEEASESVAKVLAQVDADVLALTEVGNANDLEVLRQALIDEGVTYDFIGPNRSTDTVTGQHVGVLSKIPFTSILPSIPGREHYWEELDDPETESETGVSKGMRVSFQNADGNDIHLYVVHLSSERGGHEQDQQRIAQASILRRHYLNTLDPDAMIIVAGDLNDKRGDPTLRRIRGLDDIQSDLGIGYRFKHLDGERSSRCLALCLVRHEFDLHRLP